MSNIEYSPELVAALDRLVPVDETLRGDWEDVVGRVHRRNRGRGRTLRNRPLRLALVLVAIFLLLAGVATATYFVVRASQPPPAVVALDDRGGLRALWRCAARENCGAFVTDAAFAPDGRHLAIVTDSLNNLSLYQRGLHVIDLATGSDRQLPAAPSDAATSAAQLRAWQQYTLAAARFLGCVPVPDPHNLSAPAHELAWSPDSSRLAYACTVVRGGDQVGRIYTIRADGTGRRLLRTGTASAYWPTWSPDGKRIAFSTEPAPLVPTRATNTVHPRRWVRSAIYVVDLDGSLRQLVTRAGAAPDWAPDGTTIAYSALACTGAWYRSGRTRLVTPDGRDVTPHSEAGRCGGIGPRGMPPERPCECVAAPAWSPDGSRLAVRSWNGLYVMGANGSHVRRISTTAGLGDSRPVWQPPKRKGAR